MLAFAFLVDCPVLRTAEALSKIGYLTVPVLSWLAVEVLDRAQYVFVRGRGVDGGGRDRLVSGHALHKSYISA